MSTATVVAIVVVLMLLGLGIVINQLLRLRKFLGIHPRAFARRGCRGAPEHDPPK